MKATPPKLDLIKEPVSSTTPCDTSSNLSSQKKHDIDFNRTSNTNDDYSKNTDDSRLEAPVFKALNRPEKDIANINANINTTEPVKGEKICEQTYDKTLKCSSDIAKESETDTSLTCSYCEKKFSSASILTKHQMEIHVGEKPFRCESCTKRFSAKYHYMAHRKVADRYKCAKCPKVFCRFKARLIHEKKHKQDDQLMRGIGKIAQKFFEFRRLIC